MTPAPALSTSPSFLLKSSGWSGRCLGFVLGGISVLGQAPLHLWPLTLIGFALLFMRLQWASTAERPGRAGFGSAFWFGLGYFGLGTYWIGEAFIARGPAFIPLMFPMVLGLAALLAGFWGLAGLALAKGRFKSGWAPVAFVCFFMLAEYLRGYIFSGFPWNMPGYIFPAGGAFSQGAALWTIYGQSALILALSAALAITIFSPKKITACLILALGLGGLYGFGAFRLSNANLTMQKDVLLRIVSVPFDQADRFKADKNYQIVDEFIAESVQDEIRTPHQRPLNEVTHIIWPEGAISGLAIENQGFLNFMGQNLALRLNGELPVWLFNSLRLEHRTNPKTGKPVDDYYNSSVAVTFNSQGVPNLAGYNDKYRLVPFGEFIPFGKWMESVNVPVISTSLMSISSAQKKTLTQFPGLPVGSPQICYEIIFPGLTPHPKGGPAPEFILNQSNDAWFGQSWGPEQHANIAAYRAIEEGLPLVRAASNGVSAVFDPYGRVLADAARGISSHIDTPLPKPLKLHFNSRLMILVIFLIVLGMSLLSLLFGRSKKWGAII